MLYKPDLSGRLVKWAVELGEFDITYKPRAAIKGQALADFVAEFTYAVFVLCIDQQGVSISVPDSHTPGPSISTWVLYIDGSFNTHGSRAGLVLTTPVPDKAKIEYALRFSFRASNNKAEYEALLAGLGIAVALGAQKIVIIVTPSSL